METIRRLDGLVIDNFMQPVADLFSLLHIEKLQLITCLDVIGLVCIFSPHINFGVLSTLSIFYLLSPSFCLTLGFAAWQYSQFKRLCANEGVRDTPRVRESMFHSRMLSVAVAGIALGFNMIAMINTLPYIEWRTLFSSLGWVFCFILCPYIAACRAAP